MASANRPQVSRFLPLELMHLYVDSDFDMEFGAWV
jgi:hypothetical protein